MTASRTVHRMQKVRVNGVYLEYELRGDGANRFCSSTAATSVEASSPC